MSYAINNLPSCITIGRETETAVTEIRIDCAEWLDRWPDMDVSVIVRTGRGAIYIPANLTMEGKTLVWCVDDVDTSILNKSTMEITGIAPDRHKLSEKVDILVDERLAGTTGETPDPMKPWVDRVIEAANTVGDARDDAVSAKDEAFDSANVAYKAAFDARESEKNAHASEQEAAQSANIAKDAEENTRATLVTVNGLAEYAKSSAEMAKESEEKSLQNANNAGTYATSAKESEIIARESGETAKTSAQSAQTSAGSAAESANQAKRSEEAAKGYADNTGEYARIATEKAQKATEQANSAGVSATSAEESANRASASEQNAATSAQEAKSSADSTKGYSESANEAAVNASDSAREAQVSAENAAASANNAEASKASAQVSAENARVSSQNAEDALQELRDKIASGEFKGDPGEPGKDAVVDATLTQSGQAADAKATGEAIGQLKDDIDGLDVLDLKLVRETLEIEKIYDGDIVYDCPGGKWKFKSITVSDDITGIVSIVIDDVMFSDVSSGIRIYNADKSNLFTPNITEAGTRIVDLTGYSGLVLQLQASESTECEAGTYYAKGISVYSGDITKQVQGLPDYFVGTGKIKERLSNVESKIGKGIEPADTTFFDVVISPNMLDLSSATYGKYVNATNGKLANNEKYLATDFIPVTSGMILRLQYDISGTRYDCANKNSIKPMYTAMYDANYQYINGLNSWTTLDIPDGVHYIRTSFLISWIDGTTAYGNLAIISGLYDTILPYYPYGEVISATIKPQYSPKEHKLLHTYLPPEICVAVGRTIELYNSLVCLEANKYHLDWTCDVGTDYARKWSVTGTAENVGDHTLTLKIYDDDLTVVKTLASTVKIISGDISQQKKILPIGDSLTNGKAWLSEVGTLSNGMFRYVGTRGTTIRHEGRSGAMAKWYNNNNSYTFDSNYSGSPSVSASSNPFWNGTGFSLQHYLTTQSGYVDTPDAVQLLLGTNGIALDPSNNVENIKAIVDSIQAEYPTMPIFVCNTIYRSTQDGYYSTGADGYEVGQSDFQYSADMKIMNLQNALSDALSGYDNVHIVPLSVCMDREYNFGQKEVTVNPRSSITISIPNESVHPQNEGYMQMADVMYSSYVAHLG